MAIPEERLVLRAQAGDAAAFDQLLRRYEKPLYRHIYRMLHDEQASYEALQETYLAIVRSIRKLRSRSAFRPWAYGVATRVCLKSRRTAARRHEAPELRIDPEDLRPLPDSLASAREEMERLLDRIVLLTPKLRSVILLHFVEGLTLPEVAAALEVSPGTVKSRLNAALVKLRQVPTGENP